MPGMGCEVRYLLIPPLPITLNGVMAAAGIERPAGTSMSKRPAVMFSERKKW